jgi:hypothetical protein
VKWNNNAQNAHLLLGTPYRHRRRQYWRTTYVRVLAGRLASNGDIELVRVRWCAESEAIVRAESVWVRGLTRFNRPLT